MLLDSRKIIHLFRYFWLLLAFSCLLYIFSQNMVRARTISYQLDLQKNITRDLEGLYPVTRTSYQVAEQSLQILAEPLYLQAYLPVKFENVQIVGNWTLNGQSLAIGLKQKDASWEWQKVTAEQFSLDFSLKNAQIVNNKLEFVFSLPELTPAQQVFVHNLSLSLIR